MSLEKIKDTTNLKMILMQDVRKHLERDLVSNGISTELDNLTDDRLGLKVKQGSLKTHLLIYRLSHKPLEIVLEAGHKQLKKGKIIDRSNKDRGGQRGGFYRYYLYFIIFGFVASIFMMFFINLQNFYANITPNWSPLQRTIPILGFFLVLILGRIYIMPWIRQKQENRVKHFERELLDITKNSLIELNKIIHGADTMKCWSCFKDISISTKTCEYCEAQQN